MLRETLWEWQHFVMDDFKQISVITKLLFLKILTISDIKY